MPSYTEMVNIVSQIPLYRMQQLNYINPTIYMLKLLRISSKTIVILQKSRVPENECQSTLKAEIFGVELNMPDNAILRGVRK